MLLFFVRICSISRSTEGLMWIQNAILSFVEILVFNLLIAIFRTTKQDLSYFSLLQIDVLCILEFLILSHVI